jgi:hypothetical protein
MQALLARPDAHVRRYVSRAHVDRLIAAAPAQDDPGRLEWGPHVWSLVTTECWLRWRAGEDIVEDVPPQWASAAASGPGA